MTDAHTSTPDRISEYGMSWPVVAAEQLAPRLQIASFFIMPPGSAPVYRTPGLHLYLVTSGRVRTRLPDGTWRRHEAGTLVCTRAGACAYATDGDTPLAFYQLGMLASASEPHGVPWLPGVGALPLWVDVRDEMARAVELFERCIAILLGPGPTWSIAASAALMELIELAFRVAGSGVRPEPLNANRWERLLATIEQHPGMPTVTELAREMGVSTEHFVRSFRAVVGQTPKRYIMQRRLWRARRLLEDGAMVKEAAHAVGYHDPLHFSRMYRRLFGFPPSTTPPPSADATVPGPPAGSLPVCRHVLAPGFDIADFLD